RPRSRNSATMGLRGRGGAQRFDVDQVVFHLRSSPDHQTKWEAEAVLSRLAGELLFDGSKFGVRSIVAIANGQEFDAAAASQSGDFRVLENVVDLACLVEHSGRNRLLVRVEKREPLQDPRGLRAE